MDKIIESLEERRRKLALDIEFIEKIIVQIREIQSLRAQPSPWIWAQLREFIDQAETNSMKQSPTELSTGEDRRRRVRPKTGGGPKPAIVMHKVLEILRLENHPMTRNQLLKELELNKIVVSGYEPAKVLGTILWRSTNLIVNLNGFGYWIKDKSYPPAKYFPNIDPYNAIE